MDLTILIPTMNEAENISRLIPELDLAAKNLQVDYEILVVDAGSQDNTVQAASAASPRARVIQQQSPGYGKAITDGFSAAAGEYILTMDADQSHDPAFLQSFWSARNTAEVIIGSRYVEGGTASMPLFRKVLSRILNMIFRHGLSFPWRDLSSGFRLYRASVVKSLKIKSSDFDALQEILIKIYVGGSKVREIPIHYKPRYIGSSHVRLFRFGIAYLRTFYRMWRLRNSIQSADYDDRAYNSLIPMQRYWQRRRYSIINGFSKKNLLTLDIGCGSSRILSTSPSLIGLDVLLHKLRYARKFERPLVNGSIWDLPFRDASFDCVICSEVIEHIPGGNKPFTEIRRVLKPQGFLVIGTPDYDHLTWRMIENIYRWIVPGGYADEHITRYSLESLTQLLESLGFTVRDYKYILHSEMILQCTYDRPVNK